MRIGGGEDLPLELDHGRVFDGGPDDRSAQTLAAVFFENKDVGQPGKGREIADHASEPDLRAIPRVRADNECAVSDRHRDDISRSSSGPVRMVAEVVMHNIDVDEFRVTAYPIARKLEIQVLHQNKATK